MRNYAIGDALGLLVGLVGVADGFRVGPVGLRIGFVVGSTDGTAVGITARLPEGVGVGNAVTGLIEGL